MWFKFRKFFLFYFCISLDVICIALDAMDTPSINITANFQDKIVRLNSTEKPVLILNKPFSLHLDSDEKVSEIECRRKRLMNNYYVFKATFEMCQYTRSNLYHCKSQVNFIATKDGVWKCRLYSLKYIRPITFDLDVTINDSANSFLDISFRTVNGTIEHHVSYSNITHNKEFNFIINCDICNETIDVTCISAYNKEEPIIQDKLKSRRSQSQFKRYTKLINALARMEVTWACSIPVGNTLQNIKFDVKFLKSGVAVFLVNGQKLTNIQSSGVGYDEKVEYQYREGELAKITCNKTKGPFIKMTLRNYRNRSEIGTELQGSRNLTMYVKLTAEVKEAYIDCQVKTPEFTARLYFKKAELLSGLNLQVNNLILNANYNKEEYVYEYYEGETLVITSTMKNAKCDYPKELKDIDGDFSKMNMSLVLFEEDNGLSLICNTTELRFNLTFNLIPNNDYPSITGLSSANIMLKYKPTLTTCNIAYYYTQDLSLNCSSNDPACNWIYNGVTHANDGIKQFDITMFGNATSTTIECFCPNNRNTVVQLINHNPLYDVTSSDVTESSPSAGISDSSRMWLVIELVVAATTILIIIVVTCVIVRRRITKRRLQQQTIDSNVNYENLPPHNEGPMQMPPQWDICSGGEPVYADDSITYSDPYVEKVVYAQPISNGQNKNPVPNYSTLTKAGGMDDEYASVYQESSANSQTLPKMLRNDGRYPQVVPNANCANYAEVVPKSRRNPNPVDSKYVNVCASPRYANAVPEQRTNEYAEPAYCETE